MIVGALAAGLSLADFWALTPADVTLAIEAHERRERSAYWRAGLVTATLININRSKGQRRVRPEDFVPKRRSPQTPQQMAAILTAYTRALGGEVRGD